MKVAILVPSFNEGPNLPHLLDSLERALIDEPETFNIIIINDGSSDDTCLVVSRYLTLRPNTNIAIKMLNLPFNCGVGAAMRTGFLFASRNHFDYAIQVDADGQHSPESIADILEALCYGNDLVIGSRFLGSEPRKTDAHTSRRRSWVLKLVSMSVSKACAQPISDATSGFRGSNAKLIALFSEHYPSEYLGDTLDSILLVKSKGFTIKDIPVQMRPRMSGVRSQNRFRSMLFLSRAMINIAVFSTRRKK
jgi:glycosyltransferase involved in cell wall biosynthesis